MDLLGIYNSIMSAWRGNQESVKQDAEIVKEVKNVTWAKDVIDNNKNNPLDGALSKPISPEEKASHEKEWLGTNNNPKQRTRSLEEIKFMESWEYNLIGIEHKNNKVTKQIEALEARGFKEAAQEVFEKSIEGKGYTKNMRQYALTAMGFGARARSEEEIKFMESRDYSERQGLAPKVYALTEKGFKEAARELIIGDKEYQEANVATRKHMLKVYLREVQDETVKEFMGSDRYTKQKDVYDKVRVLLREGSKFGEGSKNKDPLKLQSFKETALELLTSDKGFQGARPEYRSMFLASIGLTAEAREINARIDSQFRAIAKEGRAIEAQRELRKKSVQPLNDEPPESKKRKREEGKNSEELMLNPKKPKKNGGESGRQPTRSPSTQNTRVVSGVGVRVTPSDDSWYSFFRGNKNAVNVVRIINTQELAREEVQERNRWKEIAQTFLKDPKASSITTKNEKPFTKEEAESLGWIPGNKKGGGGR